MSSQTSSGKSARAKSKLPLSSYNPSPSFTPRQQDAQARGKDYYGSSSEDSSWESGRRFDGYGNDSYNNVQARREAAIILDSPELLMMHAQARNDHIWYAPPFYQAALWVSGARRAADGEDAREVEVEIE